MATRINEFGRSSGYVEELQKYMRYYQDSKCIAPIIAKGNIYQGILAQW